MRLPMVSGPCRQLLAIPHLPRHMHTRRGGERDPPSAWPVVKDVTCRPQSLPQNTLWHYIRLDSTSSPTTAPFLSYEQRVPAFHADKFLDCMRGPSPGARPSEHSGILVSIKATTP
ncbi:hypothetical protein C8Q80DRAFT_28571 [Daedaleopsis nitida]|nr:hypothetical protein C8Q80DRAFT_28571 [Daedaleopsis nitida]